MQTTDIHSSAPQPTRKSSADELLTAAYRTVWRWHFYAGIMFAPFLIILAFSGSIYLFKPQIEGYLYKDMLTVRDTGSASVDAGNVAMPSRNTNAVTVSADGISAAAMPIDDIISKTVSDYPGTSVASVTLTGDPLATIKLSAARNGVATTIYADPYTGRIKGMLNSDETFAAFFKRMHSELVIGGTWANRLVELAACWAVILVVTGLYLWWPRSKSAVWGTILPRVGKPGSRQFWRDLHAVPAFWLSLCMLVLIASGLPWSDVLGKQIDRLANATNSSYPPYALSFLPGPQSPTVAKDVADDVPWAAENIPVPASLAGGYLPLRVQDVAMIADKQRVDLPYTISMPRGETGVYTVSSSHSRPGGDATLHIDQYSGSVLTDVRFADYGLMAKAITFGIALHEGRLFGWVNQALGLVTCIGIMLLAVSSYFMWRKRKPQGRLGAPAKAGDKRATVGVLLIMLVFGALMPLVGASLIVMLLLDLLVIRRIRRLRHWFSA